MSRTVLIVLGIITAIVLLVLILIAVNGLAPGANPS